MGNKAKQNSILVLCTIGYVLIQMILQMQVSAGGVNLNGILVSLQFMLCLIMVCNCGKKGMIFSYALLTINMVIMLSVVILTREYSPLPGICNLLVYTVTLWILRQQLLKRELDIVTDSLTGLSNRRGLYEILKNKVSVKKPFYVFYIELDNFKYVNDQYGHLFGNALLIDISNRLKSIVGEKGQICRMGGIEFVVVLDGECDPQDYAERMLEAIREKSTLQVSGRQVVCYLNAYIGVAQYPQDALNEDMLMKCADYAILQREKNKKSAISFYHSGMETALMRQKELEELIRTALKEKYFYLVYQPQYGIPGKKLRGFEALLRLRLPDETMISPAEFIPVAESSELIFQIDEYVLGRAMEEFAQMQKLTNEKLTISVNVSAKNVSSIDFAERVEQILKAKKFPPESLEIEITEYCLVESMERTTRNIQRLKSLGVMFALDDFGTGYSSLSYLSTLPFDMLKVDKALIDDSENIDRKIDFVRAVVSLGHLMDCEVIAEGVENEKQLSLLEQNKCDFIQGFVWSKPLDYEVAKQLIIDA